MTTFRCLVTSWVGYLFGAIDAVALQPLHLPIWAAWGYNALFLVLIVVIARFERKP